MTQEIVLENLEAGHYEEVIEKLVLGLAQLRSIAKGEFQRDCGICGDTGHTAEACHHNPLLLMALGEEAKNGKVWRCFHCDAVFTDREGAQRHFGNDIAQPPDCIMDGRTVGPPTT